MNGVPSDVISDFDKGTPLIKIPISPILAVVHLTFCNLQSFWESNVLMTPLLYFYSSAK